MDDIKQDLEELRGGLSTVLDIVLELKASVKRLDILISGAFTLPLVGAGGQEQDEDE